MAAGNSPVLQNQAAGDVLRPRYLNWKFLIEEWACGHCKDVLTEPMQTKCGVRACRACIEDLFQENPVQACPFKSVHAEEGDSSPECYPHGLTYPGTSDIIFDRQAQSYLSNQPVYCVNYLAGCPVKCSQGNFQAHHLQCQFQSLVCQNKGCQYEFNGNEMNRHEAVCKFGQANCQLCQKALLRKDLEMHSRKCPNSVNHCLKCQQQFDCPSHVYIHQMLSPSCLSCQANACYVCKEVFNDQKALRSHLQDSKVIRKHVVQMAINLTEVSDTGASSVGEELRQKWCALEVTIGEAYSKLMRFRSEFDNSLDLRRSAAFRRPVERILESSENALKFLHASTLEIINRLKDITQPCQQQWERHPSRTELSNISELQQRLKLSPLVSYDGTQTWRLIDYSFRKSNFLSGGSTRPECYPFSTTRNGYKLKCQTEPDDALLSGLQRPVNKWNSPIFAFPELIPSSTLETDRFLHNECIYLKIEIESLDQMDQAEL